MNVFKLVASLTLNTDEYEQKLDNAEKQGISKFGSALSTAAKVGGAAVAAASTAVVAFGKSAVDAGQSFDSSMSQVAATMGYSTEALNTEGSEAAETFNKLREFAQKMGSETAFSATEAADALNYMALAGYDADTSISMLPNVLNLAAAGGMELATASDMITDGQSALGLSLEETTELVDKMAKASSKSNTSVSQLGDAILTIGGTAKNLKGGTTELAQALGLLADNGIKGSEGGTALRNILLNLTPKSEEAAEAMEELGLKAYDSDGKMRSLRDIFADLNKGLEGMSDQKKTNILSSIFNKVDLKSVNALLATSTERWDELSAAIDESQGAAQNMAEVQLDNLTGDVTLFQSALEGAKIAVSDKLTPTLREFVQLGSEGLSKITQAFQADGLEGAMDALGDWLGDAIVKIVDKAPTIISAGAKLLQTLVKGIVKNLPRIAETAVKIIVELANGLAESLPELVPAAVDAILAIAQALIDNIPLLVDAALKIIIGLSKGLMKSMPKLIEKIPDIIMGIVNALIDSIDLIIDAGVELFVALVENMPEILRRIALALPQIIAAIIKGLGKLGVKLADLFVKAWEGIKKVFAPVGEFFSGVWDSIVNAFSAVGQWFADVFSGAAEGIRNAFSAIGGWFSDRWADIQTAFANVVAFFANTFATAKTAVHNAFSAIGQWFADRWNDIKNVFINIGQWFANIFKGAVDVIQGAFKGIGDFFAGVWEGIKKIFAGVWDFFVNIGKNIIEGIKAGVSGAWNGFVDFFSNIMGGIQGIAIKTLKIGSPSKIFSEIGKFIDMGLAEGIEKNLDIVNDAAEELADATIGDDIYDTQEVQTITTTIPDKDTGRMFEVQRYTSPQYINMNIEIGGQKIKSILYELMQDETNRVGLKLVRGTV